MHKDSTYHVYDRILANPLMFLQLIKTLLTVLYSKQHILLSTCEITSFFSAGVLFYLSQAAQSQIDLDGFIFWHCLWHCYPLILIVLTITAKRMELSMDEDSKSERHPLLSDKVLEKINGMFEKEKIR